MSWVFLVRIPFGKLHRVFPCLDGFWETKTHRLQVTGRRTFISVVTVIEQSNVLIQTAFTRTTGRHCALTGNPYSFGRKLVVRSQAVLEVKTRADIALVHAFGPDNRGYHLDRRCGFKPLPMPYLGIWGLAFTRICVKCLLRQSRRRREPRWFVRLMRQKGMLIPYGHYGEITTRVYKSDRTGEKYRVMPYRGFVDQGIQTVKIADINPQSLKDITEDW